jgi:hypothetical protein
MLSLPDANPLPIAQLVDRRRNLLHDHRQKELLSIYYAFELVESYILSAA